MTIPWKTWRKYIDGLRKVNDAAASAVTKYMASHEIVDPDQVDDLIRYCYGLASKYGEAASTLAAQMYDAMAAATGALVEPAIPAATATYGEVAKAVLGVRKQSESTEMLSSAVARLVKMAGVDTTQQNALRDGAEWAWIPVGYTCAFCITLAGNGWQRASKKAIRGGHAEHIHANCDCTYAIRFDDSTTVEGYGDGSQYAEMYYDAPLDLWNTEDGDPPPSVDLRTQNMSTKRINAMRRQIYKENRREILDQKASAAEKRRELNSSEATEANV